VAERIKSMANTAAIPIIFITALKEPGLREKALEKYGAVGFLEKPFESSDLISMIHEALDDSTGVSSQLFTGSTAGETDCTRSFRSRFSGLPLGPRGHAEPRQGPNWRILWGIPLLRQLALQASPVSTSIMSARQRDPVSKSATSSASPQFPLVVSPSTHSASSGKALLRVNSVEPCQVSFLQSLGLDICSGKADNCSGYANTKRQNWPGRGNVAGCSPGRARPAVARSPERVASEGDCSPHFPVSCHSARGSALACGGRHPRETCRVAAFLLSGQYPLSHFPRTPPDRPEDSRPCWCSPRCVGGCA